MPSLLSREFDGPRLARPGEGAALLALLDRTFAGGCPEGMAAEYPHLYGDMERRLDWCHVIAHRGRLVAHVGVYPLDFVSPAGRVTVGGIGAVATHPAFRGRGLMSGLLGHATRHMRAQGMPLSILWGDRGRYARFGWEAAGMSFHFRIYPRAAREHLNSFRERVVVLADPDRHGGALQALHRRLPLRVERDPETFRLVMRKVHRRVHAAFAGRRLVAYALVRRWPGRHGVTWQVEEMAGSGEGVASILRALALAPRTHRVEGQVPPLFQPWMPALIAAHETWDSSVACLGQIKVVDRTAALAALGARDVARPLARLRPGPLAEPRLLFGPLGPAAVLPQGAVRGPVADRLPIPLFLWPADHV